MLVVGFYFELLHPLKEKRSKKIKQNPKKYICAGRPWISRALQGIDIAFLRVYRFFEPVSLIKKSRGWGLWYLVPWTPRLLVALLFLPLNAHRKWKKRLKKVFSASNFPRELNYRYTLRSEPGTTRRNNQNTLITFTQLLIWLYLFCSITEFLFWLLFRTYF